MSDGNGYTFGSAGGANDQSGDGGSGAGIIAEPPAFLGGGSADADSGGERFDPTIHVDPDKRNADGRYTRKRGRRGNNSASRGNTKAQNTSGIEALTNMLGIVHLGIAGMTNTPELKLEDSEAEALAKATATVIQEFDLTPDPKITAIVGLITCCGTIYGPKVYFIRKRWKEEAQAVKNVEA